MDMKTYLSRYNSKILSELIEGFNTSESLGIPESRSEEAIQIAQQILFDRGHAHSMYA